MDRKEDKKDNKTADNKTNKTATSTSSSVPLKNSDSKIDLKVDTNENKEKFQFTTQYAVIIRVISGENLVKKDLLGKSDPYVVAQINGESRKTKYIRRELNPKWNEQFSFIFKEKPSKVVFTVYDWNPVQHDREMGSASLDLKELFDQKKVFCNLLTLNNVKSGKIMVRVECREIQEVAPQSTEHGKLDGIKLEDLVSLFELTIIEARNLPNRDRLVGFNSDPFARVRYGKTLFQTSIKANTAHPKWEEKCPLWVSKADQLLMISILDADRNHGDFLGGVFLKPSSFEFDKDYNLWLPLQNSNPGTDAELSTLLQNLKVDLTSQDIDDGKPALHLYVKQTTKKKITFQFFNSVIDLYDTDRNGSIELGELLHMLNTIGTTLSEEEIAKLFKEVDKKNTGSLSRESLFELLSSGKFQGEDDMMRKVFSYMLYGEDGLKRMTMKGFFSGESDDYTLNISSPKQIDESRILVQDRESGLIVQENIPVYIKSAMRLMYQTVGGRLTSKSSKTQSLLKRMTLAKGKEMDNPKSKHDIDSFVRTHHLNLDEVLLKKEEFQTFNEFFYRKLKPNARRVAAPNDNSVATSPADCRMMVFRTIDDAKSLWIKGENFTLGHLFGNWDKEGKQAAKFVGGSLVIARLAPQDYHRYHSPVAGTLQQRFLIEGDYNTVNPIAVRRDVDVYTTNKRCIQPIETKEFGTVLLIAIAATMVGSINWTRPCECKLLDQKTQCVDGKCQVGNNVKKFEDLGYFAFGGSTTLVLFQPGSIAFDDDILTNSDNQLETLVKVGSRLGVATKPSQ